MNQKNSFICVPIIGPDVEQALLQIQKANQFADLIELRFDLLDKGEREKLIQKCQKPVIVKGLTDFFDEKILYIDSFDVIENKKKWLFSFHDFEKCPKNLFDIFLQAKEQNPKIIKIACHVNHLKEALAVLSLKKETKTPLVLIGMGDKGRWTRVYSRPYIYYVSVDEKSRSASGQLTLFEAVHIYRVKEINHQTTFFALLGDPVEQSIGHIVHNAGFNKYSINARYLKIALKKEEIPLFLSWAKEHHFAGFSVTSPLKEAIIPFLDQVEQEAKTIGAVNTVALEKGKWVGYNTDGVAALDVIETKVAVKNQKMTVLGAGGCARAIIYEALKRKAYVSITNRTYDKAKQLAKHFGCKAISLSSSVFNHEILIKAISGSDMPLNLEKMIFDVNYQNDSFGLEMFYRQAAKQWKYWFKKRFDEKMLILNFKKAYRDANDRSYS